MNEEQVKELIRKELAQILGSDKYVFTRDIEIANGRVIQLGKGVGTMLGNATDQKLGFLGTAPRTRAPLGVLIQPTGGGTGVTDAIDVQARARINDLNSLLGSVAGFGLAETTY